MKFAGIFGIFIGLLMIGQWAFFIAFGQVPEIQTEPYRIAFYLLAESITALGLIISGVGLLQNRAWSAKSYLFFTGMVVYSVLVSPGYFAQQDAWILVLMFALLLALALLSLILMNRDRTPLEAR